MTSGQGFAVDAGAGAGAGQEAVAMGAARTTVTLVLAAVLALAGCGGSPDVFGGASGSAAGGRLTVGGADFTEMLIMEQMYGQLLAKAGYQVGYATAGNREVYAKSLESGEIDVVPEYAATMAEFLNGKANGPDAPLIATRDPAQTVAAMTPLAAAKGLLVLAPARASDQNGFAVTRRFATTHHVTTLSQLAARALPLRLAAVVECPDRPFCEPGLERTYGLNITQVLPLGFGSPQAKQAVTDGRAELVLVGTTDGTLDQYGLVLLADDKHLQLADNLVPVVNARSAGSPRVAAALDRLSSVLTTADLAVLNRKVDTERIKPAEVAREYLESKGLL